MFSLTSNILKRRAALPIQLTRHRFATTPVPSNDEEQVMLVDEFNNEKGAVTRKQVREQILWHRASYIFIIVKSADSEKFLV